MPPTTPTAERLLRVRGTVQGVGFRPFALRLATELQLDGWVRNDAEGVLLRARGDGRQLDRLATELVRRAPPAARITAVESLPLDDAPADPAPGFTIRASAAEDGAISAAAPPDLALCDDCRRELQSATDRRQRYPFINCTQCGPRYSLLEALPYDRPATTMRCFRMCPSCQREYDDPADRRFHAQPNACPDCGPQLVLTDADGRIQAAREAALAQAASALLRGEIVAVKGVGGFHLMCDAGHERVVAELRRRKHREEKPLAVLFADLAALQACADVPPAAAHALLSSAAPIVLVHRRAGAPLAPSLAPGNPWIGAMVASSPVHVLLLAAVSRPLVATSANLSDEPLCIDDDEARRRLAGIADLFLGHDRAIARPVDDSVLRFDASDAPVVLRRARGFAPSPLRLPGRLSRTIACVGAQMKSTVALAAGDRLVLSPHIGDLDSPATHEVFARTLPMLASLFASEIDAVVCDRHPDYASTRFAEATGLPRLAVQHHLAHVLAVLLEHDQPPDDVLGVAWDGTGYGEDGTIWGGEFLRLSAGRAQRFARVRPFRLPGGDAAARDPRRVLLGMSHELGAAVTARWDTGLAAREDAMLRDIVARGVNAPWCSSVGRLFDAVGFLLGLGRRNSFEGQIPLAVEAAAATVASARPWPFPVRPAAAGAVWEIDWAPALVEGSESFRGDPSTGARGFHAGLVSALVDVARRADVSTVALSGGCFQNALLRHEAVSALASAGFRVLTARELPPHDGAIAAGQAVAALWSLCDVELPSPSTSCASPFPVRS